ncbi:MAG: hypothetical protein RR661_03005 [Anaerovoracaceae bacterium]
MLYGLTEGLAGHYELKYNTDKEKSRTYKGYVGAVKKERISPLVGLDKFKEMDSTDTNELIQTNIKE